MAYFRYRSADQDGKILKGSLEAVDKEAAIYIIKQKGLIPLEIDEDNSFERLLERIRHKKVPVRDIALFCRQLETNLASGITVISAMDMLRRYTSNKMLRKAISAVYDDLLRGRNLSQSLKAREGVFPELLVNMVESGELSGTLDNTMARMAVHYEKENRLVQRIRTAMTYPAVLLSVSALMVVFLVYFILPNFMMLIDNSNGEIPKLTWAVINGAEFIRTKWYMILSTIAVASMLFKLATIWEQGRNIYHRMLLRAPVLGSVIRKIISARFARTLGMLLANGIPLLSSLESVRNVVGNAAAEEAISKALTAVKNGAGLAASLEASSVFDSLVAKVVKIGEENGSLDEMLIKAADMFDSEVEAGFTQLMQLVEPAMLVLMGIVVGLVVAAMLLPMYSMLNSIGV